MSQINDVVRELVEIRFGHLPHRTCTAESPMRLEDKDKYRWHHPDAIEDGPFFNLVKCTCPHCELIFTCLPRRSDRQPPRP